MTSRFLSRNGEIYHVLHQDGDGCWLISVDNPTECPFCAAAAGIDSFQRVSAPQDFSPEDCNLSPAAWKRLALIQPLLEQNEAAITGRQLRLSVAKDIAAKQNTTVRRILRLYYRYLATGQVSFSKTREISVNSIYDWAIKTLYFSAKRFSLRAIYDMMLVQKYTDSDGKLLENAPSWSSFRNYFYSRGYHKQPRKSIARSGLTNYQRNERPVFGSSSDWRSVPGSYQMDATQTDIYLVSRHDRSKVIGRPYIYLAVDTASLVNRKHYFPFDPVPDCAAAFSRSHSHIILHLHPCAPFRSLNYSTYAALLSTKFGGILLDEKKTWWYYPK